MVHFGVGCFHFAPRKVDNSSITAKQYVDLVVNGLESVKSISDIAFDYDKDTMGPEVVFTLEKNETIPDIAESPNFFPSLDFSSLSFVIHIPRRVQFDLARPTEHSIRTATEVFMVTILSTYYHPVAFVQCVKPKGHPSASDAVFILRRYLEQEFSKNESIQFQLLGPSPFHADFDIQKAPPDISRRIPDERPFSCDQVHQEGYDTIHVFYQPKAYKSESEALRSLFENISEELGLFYAEMSLEIAESRKWSTLQKSASEVFEIATSRGLVGFIGRLFRSGYLLRRTVAQIASLSADILFNDQFLKNNYASTYTSRQGAFLGYYVKNLVKEKMRYPLQNISDGLRYIEGNRNNLWQLVAVLLAAVIGGVCGALVSVLAK